MKEKNYKKLEGCSRLLENQDVKRLVEEIISDYELSELDATDDTFLITFMKPESNDLLLKCSENQLIFVINYKDKLDSWIIDERPMVQSVHLELCPKGMVVTNVLKIYDYSIYSKEKKSVVDLISKEYVISDSELQEYFSGINGLSIDTLSLIFDKMKDNTDEISLDRMAELITTFETHMDTLIVFDGRWAKTRASATHTYLNGEDVSYIYDFVDGEDKVLRVYDLYNGVINKKNSCDIYAISLGLLNEKAFGLKEEMGITEKENNITLSNAPSVRVEDLEYVKNYFEHQMNYLGNLSFVDRDSVMKAIQECPTVTEIIKNKVSEDLGMTSETFQDFEGWLEEKIGFQGDSDSKKNIDESLINDGTFKERLKNNFLESKKLVKSILKEDNKLKKLVS